MSVDLNSIWGIVTIIGPIILVIAIVWAMRHNRATPDQERRTEEATHRMYDEQSREDDAHEKR